MKRWLSGILVIAVLLSTLVMGASALMIKPEDVADDEVVIDGVVYKGNTVIGYTTDLKASLSIQDKVGDEKITEIASRAFEKCDKLSQVVIPAGVTAIGDKAFAQCDGLTSVIFRDYDEEGSTSETVQIGAQAFAGLGNLVTLSFPKKNVIDIGDEAFKQCTKLDDLIIWTGTIQSGAFALCDSLTTVVVDTGVSEIEEAAFDNLLEFIHFTGEQKSDLNITNWSEDKIHLARNNAFRTFKDPDCEINGSVKERFRCDVEISSDPIKTCDLDIPERIIPIPALGHNFVQTEDSVRSMKAAEEKLILVPCMDHDYEYMAECFRCKTLYAEEPEIKQVKATGEHEWDDEAGYLDEEKKDEIVEPTCAAPGSTPMMQVCTKTGTWTDPVSNETVEVKCSAERHWDEKTEAGKDADGKDIHTYYKLNKVTTVEVEPACKYYGIEVTYLMCDGNHGEKGLKPCVLGENGANKCKELLDAIDAAIKALEDAAKAYTPVAGGGTIPAEGPLGDERTALANAVDAYRKHVLEDHDPIGNKEVDPETNTECIVSINTKLETEGDGHPANAVIPLSEPVRTAPDGKSDYNCAEGGIIKTLSFCPYCGEVFEDIKKLDPINHSVPKDKQKPIEPTCTEPGKTEYVEGTVCEECGAELGGKTEIDPTRGPKGHLWGDFVQTEVTKEPTCAPGKATGTAACSVCGLVETLEIELAPVANHTWGKWITSEDGKEETRTCSVCGEKQTNPLTPEDPEDPNKPGDPNQPGAPDDPSKPDPNADYTITVVQGTGGSAAASRATAKAGNSVTITVTPGSGYELDMIRIIAGGTSVVNYSNQGGGRYSFTMPAANVNVTVSFERIASGAGWGGVSNGTSGDPTRSKDNTPAQIVPQSIPRASAWDQIFYDIPTSHWAAGEINWANQMGYMNGSNGRFNPDEIITCQQMWMVLARLTGSYPANMADARRWAVEGNFADGSSPTAPVVRHQLVTALYRCAHLKSGVSRSNASLAGYADSRIVPTVARDAFAWAVSNGIVSGTANNRLDPNGTVTRAQFAVILYRFSQRV